MYRNDIVDLDKLRCDIVVFVDKEGEDQWILQGRERMCYMLRGRTVGKFNATGREKGERDVKGWREWGVDLM